MGNIMDVQTASILQGAKFKRLLHEQYAELRRRFDLKSVELEILFFLTQCQGRNTSTDIHCQLMMNRGHISQAADSLRRRGLIAAVPDQEDRRYVHYQVLEPAREIVNELTRRRKEISQQILEGVSEEELRIFRSVSEKINRNMEALIVH